MSAAKLCDRCGKLYHPYTQKIIETIGPYDDMVETHTTANGFRLININHYGDRHTVGTGYDLCQECLDELLIWFLAKKGKKDEQSS